MNLKSILISSLFASFFPSLAHAHNDFEVSGGAGLRLGGMGDAQVRDTAGTAEGRMTIDPALSYGATLGYRAQPNGFAFLSFSRQVADLHFDTDLQDDYLRGRIAIEYYQLGGNLEYTAGRWVPYFGASVGLSRWVSMGGGGARLFFVAGLDAGLKFDLHEHVHLRLAGRLPVTLAHGDIFCPSQGNCLELSKLTPQVQGEAQLGLGVSF